jgi:hypothetical protein
MTKIHVIFILVMATLAIFYVEKSFGETTTIVSPDSSIVICTKVNEVIICS